MDERVNYRNWDSAGLRVGRSLPKARCARRWLGWLLAGSFLVTATGLWAQVPEAPMPAPSPAPLPYAIEKQPCVLLKNGNVLYGESTRVGHWFHLKRSDDSVIKLRADQVSCTGEALHELYEFQIKDRFNGDLRALHADIRWSLRHGLIREAAEDALRARDIDPRHPETIQLLRQIAARMKQTHTTEDDAPSAPTAPVIQTVSHEEPSPMEQSLSRSPRVEGLDEQTIHAFAARVQPILMNRCIECHRRGKSDVSTFEIHSAQSVKLAPQIAVRENLLSLMQFVDMNDWESSIIRARATDGHGGKRASFGQEGSRMMQNLDAWLRTLPAVSPTWSDTARPTGAGEIVNDSHPFGLEPTAPPSLAPVDDQIQDNPWDQAAQDQSPETDSADRVAIPAPPSPIRPPQWNAAEPKSGEPASRVQRMPRVANPFDPQIFNRRYHDN